MKEVYFIMNNENNFIFKNFVYLNTDFLESFIAQKYKGFPKEMQSTSSLEHTEEMDGEKVTTSAISKGEIGVPIFGVAGEYTEENEGKQINKTDTESSQNVILKVQRDNMYNDFLTYLEYKNLLINDDATVSGKYIELTDVFYFIDFERIQKICDAYQAILNNGKEINDMTLDKIQEIKAKIDLLKEIIPFDALLYNQNFVILLDKEWLRVQKNHLGYIMDGKITVVGRVNKVLHMDNTITPTPNVINMLNKMQEYAMSLLHEIGILDSEKVNIVTPIAIYH